MIDDPSIKQQSLKDDMRNVLEEARMILPGIQALFGFQTMAVFSERFARMPVFVEVAYLAALGLLIVAIGLLMTPAAYHRLAEPGQVSLHMIKLSSKLVTTGMIPLMFAFAIDVYVVAVAAIDNHVAGACGAVATLVVLTTLWFAFPLRSKRANGNR
jgi:hypothetical protein